MARFFIDFDYKMSKSINYSMCDLLSDLNNYA